MYNISLYNFKILAYLNFTNFSILPRYENISFDMNLKLEYSFVRKVYLFC